MDKAANLIDELVTFSKSNTTDVPGTENLNSRPPVMLANKGLINGIIIPSIKSPATSFKLEPIIKPIARPKTFKIRKEIYIIFKESIRSF